MNRSKLNNCGMTLLSLAALTGISSAQETPIKIAVRTDQVVQFNSADPKQPEATFTSWAHLLPDGMVAADINLKWNDGNAIDRAPGAEKPIVLVWRGWPLGKGTSRASDDVTVTRLSGSGGEITEIGHFKTDNLETTCVASSSTGEIALGYHSPGVTVVSAAGVKQFTSADGIPASRVVAAAWLNGKLYLAFPGAIGYLNVNSSKFTLLASSKAVQPNSPLDGGTIYEVKSLLADPDRNCLWLAVYERTPENNRSGIWRIEADGKMHHIIKGESKPLSWTAEGFVFSHRTKDVGPWSWSFFNWNTGKTRHLPGVKLGGFSSVGHPPDFAYVAGNIVQGGGYLQSSAGKKYKHATVYWQNTIGRLGPGVVCASFWHRNLWYIEPRRSAPPTRSGE